MTTAFVLGNGVSRKGLPLNNVNQLGKIYGCNLLYEDYAPDVLVATDKPISAHIQRSGYALTHRFHTRRPMPDCGALDVPHDYFGFSSGPIAVALAALDGNRKIYLVGFDMGPVQDNTFNNVYAGKEFYKSPGSVPTYTGNWVKQIVKITENFPNTRFVRVQGKTTAQIQEFNNLPNMVHLPLNTFLDRINNQKDL